MSLIIAGMRGQRDYHNKLLASIVDGGLEIEGTYDAHGEHFVIPPTRYEVEVPTVETSVWAFLVVTKATDEPAVIFDEVVRDGVDQPYDFGSSVLYRMVDVLLSFTLQPGVTAMDDVSIQLYDRELPEENP